MNAPEKIYICQSDLAGIDYEEEWLEFPWGDNNIEYTRTDTFIEKACKWLKFNYTEYLNDTRIGIDIDEMVKDFKMDMKGE
jgi:hypothetical protein